jgi:hypothetical protein
MEKMKFEMVKCNLNPLYEIPEHEIGFYWIRGQKTAINPADPIHPVVWYHLICLKKIDYDNWFSPKIGVEMQIQFMKNSGHTAFEVIHDPSLNPKVEVKKVKGKKELTPNERELKFRQGRMKATGNDVLRLIEEKKEGE